ncbi:hypothetical protein [Streptomyces melanogenes]|uniref:hypothetical protein n=1 Tax=Streptomyces melanogenes TaxID=67326 RepID=UPI003796FA7E
MRDRIARAAVWMLRLLLPSRGRHRGTTPPAPPQPSAPTTFVICAPTAPITLVVPARTMPGVEKDGPRIPPYVRAWIQRQEAAIERRRQRCLAMVFADLGYDYPNPERHDEYAAVVA